MARDVSKFSVMKEQCPTCPFRDENRHMAGIAQRVSCDVLSKASQICHHPRLHGKKETHLCRGARNLQLEFFFRIGFLPAATDEAWAAKWAEMRAKK